jgi:hypothetical protein
MAWMANRLTPNQKSLRIVKEREWQNLVIQLATSMGWKHYHPPDNKPINGRIQKIVAGFPDLVLVKDGRLIFAELKRETGRLSPEQIEWLRELEACGTEAYVWKPSQLQEVKETLAKKSTTRP